MSELLKEIDDQMVFEGIPGDRSIAKQADLEWIRTLLNNWSRRPFSDLAVLWAILAIASSAPLTVVEGSIRPTLILARENRSTGHVLAELVAALFDDTRIRNQIMIWADGCEGLVQAVLTKDALPLAVLNFPSSAKSSADVTRLFAMLTRTSASLDGLEPVAPHLAPKAHRPGSTILVLDRDYPRLDLKKRMRLLESEHAQSHSIWVEEPTFANEADVAVVRDWSRQHHGLAGVYLNREYQRNFDFHLKAARRRQDALRERFPLHHESVALATQGLLALGLALGLDLPWEEAESYLCEQALAPRLFRPWK